MIIQEEHNIDFFKNQMPNKPYCTNNLDMGLSIRNKAKALEMLYLQANQPAIQTCLLFDLDKKNQGKNILSNLLLPFVCLYPAFLLQI